MDVLNLDAIERDYDTVVYDGKEYKLRRGVDLRQSEMNAIEGLTEDTSVEYAYEILDMLFEGETPDVSIAQMTTILEHFAARLRRSDGEAAKS